MPPVIIADTSCLILLEKIGALQLLRQLLGHVTITDIVAEEYGLPLPEWVSVQAAQNARQQQILTLTLDRGEASAIALALEQTDCLLIMDELRGRKVAQQLQLSAVATNSYGYFRHSHSGESQRLFTSRKAFVDGHQYHKFSAE